MNIKRTIITALFLTASSTAFASNYIGLQCEFKFEGDNWKKSFIVDMKNRVSEYKSKTRDGKIFGRTNLETIVAPSQITIKEPGKVANIVHKISRKSLSYERNRTSGPSMKKLGIDIKGTEVGKCKLIEIDTSENKF